MPYKTTKNRLVNEVTLGDGYPLSNNLQPLKVGGEASPLEMSKQLPDESDKAKVKVVGDLEVTNDINANKLVTANGVCGGTRHFIQAGFNYSSTAGTLVYVPINGYIIESAGSSGRNEYQTFVAPYRGYLNQVVVRSEEACGDTIVGFHKSATGTEIPNATAAVGVRVNMAVDDTAYKFAFSSNNTFDAGDILAISFDPTNDANDTVCTIELIFDISEGL